MKLILSAGVNKLATVSSCLWEHFDTTKACIFCWRLFRALISLWLSLVLAQSKLNLNNRLRSWG
ncbi:hypothetical protein D3C73_1526060 [compost metagenome]